KRRSAPRCAISTDFHLLPYTRLLVHRSAVARTGLLVSCILISECAVSCIVSPAGSPTYTRCLGRSSSPGPTRFLDGASSILGSASASIDP
ncbi:unnamed protein product, partial [Mycena citricolor]